MNSIMNPIHAKIQGIISQRTNRDDAITSVEIEQALRDTCLAEDVPTNRRIRGIVRELIIKRGVPILSHTKHGYWMATDKKELDERRKQLIRYGVAVFVRAKQMGNISKKAFMEQVGIELGEECQP